MGCLRVVREFVERSNWGYGPLEVEIPMEGRGRGNERGVGVGYD